MGLMTLYNRSPIFVQNMMTTAQGFLYRLERYGAPYRKALRAYRQTDYTDGHALAEAQWARAEELIRHALANSEFYREFYRDVDVETALKNRDLSAFPVLEKEIVRQNIERMYTLSPKDGVVSNTSGTTGKSMRFVHTKEDFQARMAYLDAFKMQHGFIPMKMKRASFSSAKVVPPNAKTTVFWRDNHAIRQRIYSGYHCKGDNVRYFVESLNRWKPQSLDGYPSAMYEIAQYILQNNITLDFTPIAIFPTAETLLPHYKQAIEKAFRCPVRDQYASSEGAPFINECTDGKLHYCMDTGIIEFCEDGRMLLTCFETHGTPLIRYDIGDKAFLSDADTCGCGCAMPIVERIEGRTHDFIQSPRNGKFSAIYMSLVSGEFHNCMKAMQFVQNDLHAVDVNIETDDAYDPGMDQIIIDKLHYSLGDEVEIRIHRLDEIPKDPSGKFRFIINNVRS